MGVLATVLGFRVRNVSAGASSSWRRRTVRTDGEDLLRPCVLRVFFDSRTQTSRARAAAVSLSTDNGRTNEGQSVSASIRMLRALLIRISRELRAGLVLVNNTVCNYNVP